MSLYRAEGHADMKNIYPIIAVMAVAFSTAGHAQTAVPPPPMTQAESEQLMGAAGFRIDDGAAYNACGKLASPHASFGDINGDGRPEAMVVDESLDCYGGTGDWFGVLVRDEAGQWRRVLGEAGTLRWQGSRSQGWLDALIVSAGRCPYVARFDGQSYRAAGECAMPMAAAFVQEKAVEPTGTASVSPQDRAAAFKAAGFTQRADRMIGCDTEPEWPRSNIEFEVMDLNGDGRPEAMIREENTACYGQIEVAFYLVTRDAPGKWRKIAFERGHPQVLENRRQGWPDIELGGPGFGKMPVIHWNGKAYVQD